ncbi:rod shape-determining protein [Rhodohalobacter mucosus]|uniref:Cell shape-determining protein MreB n=1 Tax=Rhodohalobacter mucosus TaxID=2079485 RepID=A0A316TUG3_9BACT|nr:rod shape-determining protein [Rhodohalobacter mucosus]PWN07321.1 rod shape-determining protein [Rhodohalobacter mucosus]
MSESIPQTKAESQTSSGSSPTAKPRKPGLFSSLNTDLAIDLGTVNTLIHARDQGIVLNEPTIVALNPKGQIVTVGQEARLMHEKTHKDLRTVRPLKGGVIADFDIAEKMMREMIRKVMKKRWFSSVRKLFVTVPNGITDVERMAVRDSAENAGAKEVFLVEETIAAAVGIGLDVNAPYGNMVVDIGGGTTEIAIISLGGTVYSQSVRLGGEQMNEEIVNHIRRKYNLLIGERTAEEIKHEIGSAMPGDDEREFTTKGRNLVSGVPKTLTVTSADVREAISETVNSCLNAITKSLENTPPELSADILDRGIMLTGGGALLRNMDKLISDAIDLPVHVAEDPLTTVVRGTGMILEHHEKYETVLM